jgi:molybdopterin/thiamine biosynthesis adenylyltransferase
MPNSRSDRYSRNEGLFGVDGQRAIAGAPVTIVGLGGLGSHVAQQLAYLGTRTFALVDHDHVTNSSMNRLVTADEADVAAATPKVQAARRRILAVNPDADLRTVAAHLDAPAASDTLAGAAVVFGCVDNDLARLQMTRLCSALAVPLFDLATDVDTTTTPVTFGGRVVCCTGNGCLVCLGVLDPDALARASMTAEQAAEHERIYGVDRAALDGTGPMVVSINGMVASLAVTEFIAFVTGLRPVNRHLSYYGHLTQIRLNGDLPADDCYYCDGLWSRSASKSAARSRRSPSP